jgi:hypothetical protein
MHVTLSTLHFAKINLVGKRFMSGWTLDIGDANPNETVGYFNVGYSESSQQ